MVRTLVAVGIALFAIEAQAQVSGSVSLLSDYRFRGVSLSDDKPAAQLTINADLPSGGWYAGALLSSVRLDQQDAAQLLGYAGYVGRIAPELSWEAGATYSRFTSHDAYAYTEAYAGLAWKQLVARVYYSRDYFNAGGPTLYLDLHASQALSGPWYVFGHVGWLRSYGDLSTSQISRYRSDVRLGIGFGHRPFDIQLAWSGLLSSQGHSYDYGYPVNESVTRDAWLLSLSYNW